MEKEDFLMKVKILLLSANPKNTNSLRLAEEFREIKESIKLSPHRDSFEVFQGEAIRPKELRRLILEKSPHIIHFSGHGEKDGILLENDSGETHQVHGEVLKDLFSLFDSINCVILNSCYSTTQAEHLKSVVPYIIGMSKSIKDQSSINFSIGFYDAIASNRSVEDSFRFGINAIETSDRNENHNRSLDIKEDTKIKESDIPVIIKGYVSRSLPTFTSVKQETTNKTREEKQNKSHKTQITIAIIALIGTIGSAIISNPNSPIISWAFTSKTNKNIVKNNIDNPIHISILDNPSEETTYCNLVDEGKTNAYAIKKALYPLHPKIEAEEESKINPSWELVDFEDLIKKNSSLYIIHASAFHDKNNPTDGMKINSLEESLAKKQKHQKLLKLLDFIIAKKPEAKFLIYSRSFIQGTAEAEKYTKEVTRIIPQLSGKIFIFEFIPPPPKKEVCWTQENLRILRQQVESILGK